MSNFRSLKNESHTKESSQLEQSAQPPRDFADGINDITSASSLKEISLIETVTSFLEENGASDVDPKVLRNLAEALSKRVDDTSPGTLQDVTMDTSYNFAYRSHSGVGGHGATSPMVLGRSVRDLEEQMSALRKENFNLKLRIYFIEESMPGYKAASDSDGKETLAKQLIDAKIDNEVLRKELQEKQEILKEAAQAITQMENMQKDAEAKSQTTIAQLQERIQLLEKTNLLANSAGGGDGTTSAADKVATEIISSMEEKSRELGAALAKAEQKNKRLVDKICELEEKLQKTESSLVSCEEKIREQAIQNAELLEAADRKQEQILQIEQNQNASEELNNLRTQLADKMCELQEAEEKLAERAKLHEQACRAIQKLMHNVSSQQKEINKLKSANQNQNTQNDNSSNNTKETTNTNSAASALELTGLSRSMSDTEAFVELSMGQKQRYELKMIEQEELIKQLRAEVKKKTANLQDLVNRELWEKNREIERLTKLVAGHGAPLSPTGTTSANELQQSFSDVEYAKAMERNKLLQRKLNILIQRLSVEQKNESVVSQLRHELRQAKADAESADKWRRECADVCSVLTLRLEELAGFLNSLLKHKDVLGALAADRRRAMRRAIDRSLDLSKSLNMTLSISGLSIGDQSLAQLSNLSEILGDVECGEINQTFNSHEELHPQTPTIEILKAENKALKKELEKRRGTDVRKERRSLPLPPTVQENQSESEAWSEPDRKVSMARIGLEDPSSSLVKELPSTRQQCTDSDSEALSQSRQMTKLERNRTQERITQLEQLIAQRDERILSIQCQLVEADNRLKQENLRVIDLTQELTEARQRNEALHADLLAIGEHDSNDTTLFEQLEEKQLALEKLQKERDRFAAEAEISELQLDALRSELNEMEVKHELAMSLAAEHEKVQMSQLKNELEQLMQQRLTEQQRLHEQALSRDWIASSAYEEIKQQLVELQRQYMESMRTIEYHQENEQELKQTLVDSELAARALKKQLDESTLQASKAVLERTKASNDKLLLEQRVEELNAQLTQLQTEHTALVTEMANQQQQCCDVSQSGYTSEEVPVAAQAAGPVSAQRVAAVGAQRMNNSSPDLGIESDAGRVSSVELSNAQHALLKTVELSNVKQERIKEEASVNTKDNTATATATATTSSSATNHDCAKVDQENAELRRKLIRTKRAFEDTYEKLRLANITKAQVEKDIKNQILKTHNVLRNVRSNMENEL